jgi:hypothetical protein
MGNDGWDIGDGIRLPGIIKECPKSRTGWWMESSNPNRKRPTNNTAIYKTSFRFENFINIIECFKNHGMEMKTGFEAILNPDQGYRTRDQDISLISSLTTTSSSITHISQTH